MTAVADQKPPPVLRLADVADAAELCRNLNDIFADFTQRLAVLEQLNGLKVLADFEIKTGAAVGPGVNPFPKRIALPGFTPVGLVLVSLKNMVNGYAAAVIGSANAISWEVQGGGNALLVHYITGLSVNTTYNVRLAALRG